MIISTARKIQIIADRIAGRPVTATPDQMDQPWSNYLTWVEEHIDDNPDLDIGQLLNDFYTRYILRGPDDAQEHYKLIRAAIAEPIRYPSAAEIIDDLPNVRWLWPGWIPRGLVSLLAATPGTGKSYLALDLAHRMITGSTWPDGKPVERADRVLYVDAEFIPSIIKLRLSLWNDEHLEQLTLMWPDPDRPFINLDDIEDRERLWDMCYTTRPSLVIIDSYGSVTLRGENNKEDVQALLAFLGWLAQDFDCGLLLVHHLRKSTQQTTFLPISLDSIRGSSHISAMARVVIGMQWIPTKEFADENGPRRLWMLKSNVAQHPDPLGVLLVPHPANKDVALLQYTDDVPEPYHPPTKTDECVEWLEDLLLDAEEPLKPSNIVELGKEAGFSRRTIYRARAKMTNVLDTENPSSPENCWTVEKPSVVG